MQRQNLGIFDEKVKSMQNYLLKYNKFEKEEVKQMKPQFSYLKSELTISPSKPKKCRTAYSRTMEVNVKQLSSLLYYDS